VCAPTQMLTQTHSNVASRPAGMRTQYYSHKHRERCRHKHHILRSTETHKLFIIIHGKKHKQIHTHIDSQTQTRINAHKRTHVPTRQEQTHPNHPPDVDLQHAFRISSTKRTRIRDNLQTSERALPWILRTMVTMNARVLNSSTQSILTVAEQSRREREREREEQQTRKKKRRCVSERNSSLLEKKKKEFEEKRSFD
jgi:hypothetical protein